MLGQPPHVNNCSFRLIVSNHLGYFRVFVHRIHINLTKLLPGVNGLDMIFLIIPTSGEPSP